MKRDNRTSGAAALEFALVAPLFLTLIIGTVELAHWAWGAAATRGLAAGTARCITVTPRLCAAIPATRLRMASSDPLLARSTTLSFERSACGIRVTATGGFPALLTPGLGPVTAHACAG